MHAQGFINTRMNSHQMGTNEPKRHALYNTYTHAYSNAHSQSVLNLCCLFISNQLNFRLPQWAKMKKNILMGVKRMEEEGSFS